jgi:hypothetical protein
VVGDLGRQPAALADRDRLAYGLYNLVALAADVRLVMAAEAAGDLR